MAYSNEESTTYKERLPDKYYGNPNGLKVGDIIKPKGSRLRSNGHELYQFKKLKIKELIENHYGDDRFIINCEVLETHPDHKYLKLISAAFYIDAFKLYKKHKFKQDNYGIF